MEKKAMPVGSQENRKLPTKKFKENSTIEFDLPVGTVIKEIVLTVSGKYNLEFDDSVETKRKLHKYGFMDAIFRDVKVNDGIDTIKAFRGVEKLRRQARYLTASSAPILSKVNSSDLGLDPDVGAPIESGLTGQDIAFSETVNINFENKLSNVWVRTLFNTLQKPNAKLELNCNSLKSILAKSEALDVDAITSDIDIDVTVITNPSMISIPVREYWRESYKAFNITGQQAQQPYELTKGARVQGFWITAYMGSANRRVTLDEAKKIIFEIRLNGTRTIKRFSLFDLQSENLAKTQISKIQDGSAYVNFLQNSQFSTALPTATIDGVQNYELYVTTPNSFDYTKSLELLIEQDDIMNM